jgi:hypothetical protein
MILLEVIVIKYLSIPWKPIVNEVYIFESSLFESVSDWSLLGHH